MKDNSVKLVILGFTTILILMFILVFISQHQMRQNNQILSSLITDTNVKIQMANTMRDAIRLRENLMYKMQLTEDIFDRDDIYMQFLDYAGVYKEARRKLLKTSLNENERSAIKQLDRITAVAQPINDMAAENLLHHKNFEDTQYFLRDSKTLQKATLAVLDKLVEMENKVSIRANLTAHKHYKNTSYILYILTTASIFLCMTIIWLVIHNVRMVNKQITYQATHDDLTGLVNRYEFENRVQTALQHSKVDNSQHALLFMDLDQFKIVNDSCGHLAGDRLLQRIPELIYSCIRRHDTLARLGGDEFGVLLENCDIHQAVLAAEEIREKILNFQFLWKDKKFSIGISIGITAINHSTSDIQHAFSSADAACYIAKENGRNLVHIFNENDDNLIKQHNYFQWFSELTETSDTHNFQLYFQPIVPLQESIATSGSYYEVLLRYVDDKGNIHSPDKFLPAAERFGKMQLLDRWVIKNALRIFSENKSHVRNSKLSINLSGRSMSSETLPDYIQKQINTFKLKPHQICFEITETEVIASMDIAIALMKKIKALGCQFSLDDFGSGLSSFCYLKNLPVDILKIDGAFVKNIPHDPINRALIESIHNIGKIMNMKTVAECVESREIIEVLKKVGVDYVQGYAVSKPLKKLPDQPFEYINI